MRFSTFKQQRHEGNVWRAEFGYGQPVGPVVTRWILQHIDDYFSNST